jgi:hypothetical protein
VNTDLPFYHSIEIESIQLYLKFNKCEDILTYFSVFYP